MKINKLIATIAITSLLINILNFLKTRNMAHSIDELLNAVRERNTLDASLVALMTSFKGKLDAELANTDVPADVQAKIDAAFEELSSNSKVVSEALVSNTEQQPTSTDGTTTGGEVGQSTEPTQETSGQVEGQTTVEAGTTTESGENVTG